MEKETLFIAFSTQKGGIGKSALTVLTASYMHYVLGKSVAVVDCDYPQYSIMEMRKRDSEQIMKDNYFKRMAFQQFKSIGKKAYPVTMSNPVDAIQSAQDLMTQSEEMFDMVLY